ncbi:putative dihydrofolate reductase [Mimivirus AB-566-O17]|uniref:Putative dihydrofolate reductase n=1 Tax=Mimivirus AB-566-O17 TaxID=1988039 RepID=A0A1X9VNR6_9VIRU|nr:putative dihydrofolate reductase [Mimivirus AB-566-O17]
MTTDLYGNDGDKWNSKGVLLNYSYVGKLNGIPDTKTLQCLHTVNVRDYGAKGDSTTDDTQAFKDAIEYAKAVVYIPDGTYVLKDRFLISKPLIIRGESMDNTILSFPSDLTDLFGNTYPKGRSQYAFGTNFFEFVGKNDGIELAKVTGHKNKGNNWIQCDSTSNFKPGQWIKIIQKNNSSDDLDRILYGNDSTLYYGNSKMSAIVLNQINEVKGTGFSLVYPLVMTINPDCDPRVYSHESQVCGLENLSFLGKDSKSGGHFEGTGNNFVLFKRVYKGYINNVIFHNADIGLTLSDCISNTINNVRFTSKEESGKRYGRRGHHGLWINGGGYNLISKFRFDCEFVHDISVEGCTVCNVFEDGLGVNLNFDHHRAAPYGNLFTDINVGYGSRYYSSSGNPNRGAHSGQYTTFWGIRSNGVKLLGVPRSNKESRPFGVNINLIGEFKTSLDRNFYIESIDVLEPMNIYKDMKENYFKGDQKFDDYKFEDAQVYFRSWDGEYCYWHVGKSWSRGDCDKSIKDQHLSYNHITKELVYTKSGLYLDYNANPTSIPNKWNYDSGKVYHSESKKVIPLTLIKFH